MDLTGGLSALAQLELNASEELSGDQAVGYNHHHSRDEEQSEQQQHIPEKQPEWEGRNNTQRGGKGVKQSLPKTNRTQQILSLLAGNFAREVKTKKLAHIPSRMCWSCAGGPADG